MLYRSFYYSHFGPANTSVLGSVVTIGYCVRIYGIAIRGKPGPPPMFLLYLHYYHTHSTSDTRCVGFYSLHQATLRHQLGVLQF